MEQAPESSSLSHKSHATVTLMSSAYLADWYCSMQDRALSKTIAIFFLPAGYIALSGLMKGSRKGGSFLVGLRLIFLCSEVEYVIWSVIGPYHAIMMGYEGQ